MVFAMGAQATTTEPTKGEIGTEEFVKVKG